jgi:hypothetical protein
MQQKLSCYYGNATGCIGHVTKENPICNNIVFFFRIFLACFRVYLVRIFLYLHNSFSRFYFLFANFLSLWFMLSCISFCPLFLYYIQTANISLLNFILYIFIPPVCVLSCRLTIIMRFSYCFFGCRTYALTYVNILFFCRIEVNLSKIFVLY